MGALALIEVDIPFHLESDRDCSGGSLPMSLPSILKSMGFLAGAGAWRGKCWESGDTFWRGASL